MSYKNIDVNLLEEIIVPAIDLLYKKDKDLLKRDAGERTIVANIYCKANEILQRKKKVNQSFEDLNIDIEYNRNFFDSKEVFEKCEECTNSNCVNIVERFRTSISLPDFLIHNRGTNDNNQVIIEFKKVWNTKEDERLGDKKKLIYFTCQKPNRKHEDKDYKYRIGYFIDLDTDKYYVSTYQDANFIDKRCRQGNKWQ